MGGGAISHERWRRSERLVTSVVDVLRTGPGRSGFIEEHRLWGEAQYAAAEQARRIIDEQGIELVRVSFPDPHGILRGKTLTREAFEAAMRHGCRAPSTLLLKDTAGRTVFPVFDGDSSLDGGPFRGASDIVLVADPVTFHVLPWVPRTAWVLCDIYLPDGAPVPFSTRHIYKRVLAELGERDLDFVVGLETEFHVFRTDATAAADVTAGRPGEPAPPPRVHPISPGYQLLCEDALDPLDDVVQLLRDGLHALDLGLRSIEAEFGPSQLEMSFRPRDGLRAADDMVLCRSAVKQLCRRHGYHATFMARPQLADLASSGWHLHQSLRSRPSGENAFAATSEDEHSLSDLGVGYLAGLLEHASGCAVFTTPTINGYKRYRPSSVAPAPERIVWAHDNRGAMLRVVGRPGDAATSIENRSGEPTANPYLYMASQLIAGLDGIDRGLAPGPPAEDPYSQSAPKLPGSLMEALDALKADSVFVERLGAPFVNYIHSLKQSEVDRYLGAVSDWEQREYFSLF